MAMTPSGDLLLSAYRIRVMPTHKLVVDDEGNNTVAKHGEHPADREYDEEAEGRAEERKDEYAPQNAQTAGEDKRGDHR